VGDCFLTIGMFAILWSFGKNKMFKDFNKVKFNYNRLNLAYRQTRSNSSYSSYNIGPYLAGLIEGDGHVSTLVPVFTAYILWLVQLLLQLVFFLLLYMIVKKKE
jgi:hypothetical protein